MGAPGPNSPLFLSFERFGVPSRMAASVRQAFQEERANGRPASPKTWAATRRNQKSKVKDLPHRALAQ